MASEVSSIPTNKQDKKTFKTLKEALKAQDEGIKVGSNQLYRLAMKDEGPYECEISFEECEAFKGDLNGKEECDKYPGHEDFIPVNKLDLDSLPDCYKEQEILDILNLQANLTVRIKTKYISWERANPKEPVYSEFCKENAGRKIDRFGTGTVIRVIEGKASDGQVCPCKKCQDSGNTQDEWFTLVVATARHVIFDGSEAKDLEVLLFYDSDDSIKDGGKAIKLDSDITYQRINQDVCSLDIITHDKSLGQRLSDNCKQFFEKGRDAAKLFKKEDEDWALVPIVSHPHGYQKHVSFGHFLFMEHDREKHFAWPPLPTPLDEAWRDVLIDPPKSSKLAYDASTCPGSSGALIVHYKPGQKNSYSFHEQYRGKAPNNFSGDDRLVNMECHQEASNYSVWRKIMDLINDTDKVQDLWKFLLKDDRYLKRLAPRFVDKIISGLTDYVQGMGGSFEHTGDYEWLGDPNNSKIMMMVMDEMSRKADTSLSSTAHTNASVPSTAKSDYTEAVTSSTANNDAGTKDSRVQFDAFSKPWTFETPRIASEVSSIPADKQDKKTFKTFKEALKARDEGIKVGSDDLNCLAMKEEGPYECEIFLEECQAFEVDLKKRQMCDKRPKHKEDFTPVNELNLNSLPDGYKKQEILDILNLQANLTVRIKTKYISWERANPKEPVYSELCKENAGGKFNRFGTGMVIRVIEGKASDGQVCPCKKCQDSGNSQDEWFTLVVATARHVIFDKSEAKDLEVLLFYDSDDSIKEGGKAIKLDSYITYQRINQDVCSLDIITHDKSLGQRLSDNCKQFFEKGQEAAKLFKKDEDRALSPIVSHPHGYPKHVSFGHFFPAVREEKHLAWSFLPAPLNKLIEPPENFKLAYDTPTCLGSSGALIVHYKPGQKNSYSFHEQTTRKKFDNLSGDDRLVNMECHQETTIYPVWRKITDLINDKVKVQDLWKFLLKDDHYLKSLAPRFVDKLISGLTVGRDVANAKMAGDFLDQTKETFQKFVQDAGESFKHSGEYDWLNDPKNTDVMMMVIDALSGKVDMSIFPIANTNDTTPSTTNTNGITPSTANTDAGTPSTANTDGSTPSTANTNDTDAVTSSTASNDAGTKDQTKNSDPGQTE